MAELVHPDAQSQPDERIRHERFLLTRMMAGFVALACLPIYLVLRGTPSPLEYVAILCLAAPIPAAVLLSRAGTFTVANMVWVASVVGLMLCIVLTAGTPGSSAILWLVVPAAVAHASALGLLHARLDGARQAAVRSGAARNRSLCAVLDDLVTWHDHAGQVIEASGCAEKIFGVAPCALRGKGLLSRVHVPDRPAFLKAISDATAGDGTVVAQIRIHVAGNSALFRESTACGDTPVGRDARVIWAEMRVHRVDGCDEDEPCAIAVLRDISALTHHQEELKTAREEAARAGETKGQFLAMVSHELRTPLNAIIGFSEVLTAESGTEVEPEKHKEYLQIIRNSGEHLLQVVNTLLDMSKIEAGKFDVVPEPFEINAFTHGCCDLMGLKAEQAGITLAREIDPGLPELIADRRACKQMVINLLSNAIKFTPAGGRVTLSVRRERDQIVFVVSDTGIGISEADLPKLGDPFFQARSAYDRRHEGTGLGLSVVRGLVGLHRGSLSIESALDEGTTVTVSLPIDCRTGSLPKASPVHIHALSRPRASARALKVG